MSYDKPDPAALKLRYPAFAAVDDAVVQYWLTDAERGVDTSWIEGDYAVALIELACHNMTKTKVAGITTSEIDGFLAAGVSEFRSGTFVARFSDEAIKVAVAGGYGSTVYGLEYVALLMKSKGGPRVTAPGSVPCGYGFNGFAGQLPGYGF